MELSEAIRLGSTMKPQGYGEVGGPDHKKSCAMGAAIDAIGGKWEIGSPEELLNANNGRGRSPSSNKIFRLPKNWLPVTQSTQSCPVTTCQFHDWGLQTVTHLNDSHRWTREQIADWVETVEITAEELEVAPEVETCEN